MKFVVIRSVVEILNKTWSSMFDNYRDAKIIIIELEQERRGEYEPPYVWDGVIEKMYDIERMEISDGEKTAKLMNSVCQILLLPTTQFPKIWLMKEIPKLKDKINYYKYNLEEE